MGKKIGSIILVCLFLISGCGKTDTDTSSVDEIEVTTEFTEEQVLDTVSPEIATSSDAICCKVGDAISYDEYFSISDDVDDSSSIKSEIDDSRVDYSKVGKYSLKISATDSSNNKTSIESPVYIYNEYTQDEVSEIINKLIDEKFYDFNYGEFVEEDKIAGYPVFGLSDNTAATDEPSGSDNIYGWIDYLVNVAQLCIYVDSEDYTDKSNKQVWNRKLVLIIKEITSYAEVYDLQKVEILSKDGKMEFNKSTDLFINIYEPFENEAYKGLSVWFDFNNEDRITEFKKIINGTNAQIKLVSESNEAFATIKLDDTDIKNYNSELAFYDALGEYITNTPKRAFNSTEIKASETDSESE